MLSAPVEKSAVPNTISADNYAYLQRYIYQESGIVIEAGKNYLLESRLLPIVRQEHLSTLNDLCNLLRATAPAPLRKQVVESMTTNETLFFRDTKLFEALQTRVFPKLIHARRATRKLNIWSAAASSGQEAYSLAMMLTELDVANWNIRILATDLNQQILDRASSGRYLQIEVNRGLPAKYLVKYFTHVGLDWQIDNKLRSMVESRPFDLRSSMRALGPFDIVFCRNVLIYFDVDTKKRILNEIRGTLCSQGLLVLGAAETTLNLDEYYTRVLVGSAAFYQVP